tara:strand:- start:189 stop:413 length:225 start_codon:yes stop_codon:yes gene_type:complete
MDFSEYFKKMCGDPDDATSSTFKVNGTLSPFSKKELRWLKDQLETCIEWDDPQKKSKHMYKTMLKKVEERLELL